MDRRTFLRLTGLATIPIAVPLLAACSDDSDGSPPETAAATEQQPTAPASPAGPASGAAKPGSLQSLVNSNTGQIQVLDAQAETLISEKRIAFGLRKDNAALTGAIATVYIGQNADAPPVADARASWVQGEVADKALYVADLAFPTPGEWLVGVSARLKDGTVYGGGTRILVLDKSPSPYAGEPAISVATPTVANPLQADPLCSNSPVCPMHAVSLDVALKSGKPTVLTFSAPAYCATETCGPVVHLITKAVPAYANRFNFVHVEAYDKDAPGTLVSAAAAWKLTSEPFTFFIGSDGVVRDRLAGAFGEEELAARLTALAA